MDLLDFSIGTMPRFYHRISDALVLIVNFFKFAGRLLVGAVVVPYKDEHMHALSEPTLTSWD